MKHQQNLLELLDVGVLRSEKIFLSDALGRILAEDIIANENAPKLPDISNGWLRC